MRLERLVQGLDRNRVVASLPPSFPHLLVRLTVSQDKRLWDAFTAQGYTVYSAELLLAGVLRQALELDGVSLQATVPPCICICMVLACW
jgi:hypothetical protein